MFLFKLIPPKFLSKQARKPSGWFGRVVMSRLFNKGNADLNDLVKDLLELQEQDSVLEIGFGPGTLIHQMAQITTQGVVEGIDFSETMLTLASETNKQFIASGRVKLQRGNCNAMPYSDESFDKVCTANTIYFWENPNETFKEIFRVVKSGGKLVVGFRDKLKPSCRMPDSPMCRSSINPASPSSPNAPWPTKADKLLCCKACLPLWKFSHGGTLLNICSEL
jgi:ubiquinone/menaquinone biosynthesis C-methylase UbiE